MWASSERVCRADQRLPGTPIDNLFQSCNSVCLAYSSTRELGAEPACYMLLFVRGVLGCLEVEKVQDHSSGRMGECQWLVEAGGRPTGNDTGRTWEIYSEICS